jgi:hypothetical protein
MHTRIYTHTHTHKHTHTNVQAITGVERHLLLCLYNTYIYIHIYIYIYTYIQTITGVERHPLLCKASREIIKNNNFTNIDIVEAESFSLNVGNKGYRTRANVIVSETLDAWIIEVCITMFMYIDTHIHKCVNRPPYAYAYAYICVIKYVHVYVIVSEMLDAWIIEVCMHINICVYVNVYICIHAYTYAFM